MDFRFIVATERWNPAWSRRNQDQGKKGFPKQNQGLLQKENEGEEEEVEEEEEEEGDREKKTSIYYNLQVQQLESGTVSRD